jgi:hypothetical protein
MDSAKKTLVKKIIGDTNRNRITQFVYIETTKYLLCSAPLTKYSYGILYRMLLKVGFDENTNIFF